MADEANNMLTRRQQEVIALIARGLTTAEISAALFIAEPTTKLHISNAVAALGARNRAHAVALWVRSESPDLADVLLECAASAERRRVMAAVSATATSVRT